MTPEPNLATPGDADIPALARLIHFAFASPVEGAAAWLRSNGVENLRVVRPRGAPDSPPIGTLMRIPMGQHFGGRSVPMTGIAGVAVAPEARGGGLALGMMRAAIRAIADETPLSALYASTQSLYRQAGFEQGGQRVQTTVPLSTINVRERAGQLVQLTDAHKPAVKACYARFAPSFDGPLDRGPYVWGRIESYHGESYEGFGVLAPGGNPADPASPLDGYVYINQRRKPTVAFSKHDIYVSDVAFATPGAGRRILGFLSDFAMVADAVTFNGPAHHPLLAFMPLQLYTTFSKEVWMVRICDFKRAIELRGWPRSTGATATVSVSDDLVDRNNGVWEIAIADGVGRAKRVSADPGAGPADIVAGDIRGFVPLYTGLMSPAQARLAGFVTGSDRAIDSAGAIFRAGAPWTSDFF
jgi:predicted acetyltransferase